MEPKLADNLAAVHRYNAACAAALAACGQGNDADNLDGKECARLRGQALDWLRARAAGARPPVSAEQRARPGRRGARERAAGPERWRRVLTIGL